MIMVRISVNSIDRQTVYAVVFVIIISVADASPNATINAASSSSKCLVIRVLFVQSNVNKSYPTFPSDKSGCSARKFKFLWLTVRFQGTISRFHKKVLELEKKYNGPIHVMWEDDVRQETAFLATKMRIILLTKRTKNIIPKDLSKFLSSVPYLPPKIMEYRAIASFAASDRVSTVIVLCEPDVVTAVANRLAELLPAHLSNTVVAVKVTNKTLVPFDPEHFPSGHNIKTLYLCIPVTTRNETALYINRVRHIRGNGIRIYLPYPVFEEIYFFKRTTLMKLLNSTQTFVTTSMFMVDSKQKFIYHDVASYIGYMVQKSLLQDCYDQACVDSKSNYTERVKVFQKQTNKMVDDGNNRLERLNIVALSDFYSLINSHSERHRLAERLFSHKYMVASWKNNVPSWTRKLYKVVVNLESPHVMTRPLSGHSDCSYGLPCRYFNSTSYLCCFGLTIDVFKYVLKRESMHNAATCRLHEGQEERPDVQILVKRNHARKLRDNEYLQEFIRDYESNDLISELNRSDVHIAIGSHAFVSSNLINRSFVTVPYFSSSIGIIISTKNASSKYASFGAFLAPFGWRVWCLIFVSVHVSAISTVIYEWKSPYGLTPNGRNRKRVYSFPSALTLCYSVLFSHTVPTKSPKCWSCRFLVNVYAFFCLIILASYTANLAACMVGDRAIDLRSINDLSDLKIETGQYRVATVMGSGTELYIRRSMPDFYRHIRLLSTAQEAFEYLINKKIDTFVYDVESLMYFKRVYHSEQLDLIGKPFSHVSYTIAISHKMKEGRNLRDCISSIFSEDAFIKSNHMRSKLWTREVPGRNVNGALKSSVLNTNNFIGPLILFCFGIGLGVLTLVFEFIVYYFCVPCCRKMKNKTIFLPLSQRLYRHFYTIPNYNKHTYTERYWRDIEKPIAERLSNSRRESGINLVDLSKLLSFATSETNIESTATASVDMALTVNTTEEDPLDPLVPTRSRSIQPRVTFPSVPASMSVPLLNNVTTSPTVPQNTNWCRKRVHLPNNLHNIAVQTDVDAYISNQLVPVDTNIALRTREFENDLREMREQIAQLMRDKERLLRKLAAYEGRARNELELELQNSVAAEESFSSIISDTHNVLTYKNNLK